MLDTFIKQGCDYLLLEGKTLSEHKKKYLLPFLRELLSRVYQARSSQNDNNSVESLLNEIKALLPFESWLAMQKPSTFSVLSTQEYLRTLEIKLNLPEELKYTRASTPLDIKTLKLPSHLHRLVVSKLPSEQLHLANSKIEGAPGSYLAEHATLLEKLQRIDHATLSRFNPQQREKIFYLIATGMCNEKVINHLNPNEEFEHFETVCFLNFVKASSSKLASETVGEKFNLAFPYLNHIQHPLLEKEKTIFNLANRSSLFISQIALLSTQQVDAILKQCEGMFPVRLSTLFLSSCPTEDIRQYFLLITSIRNNPKFQEAVENDLFDPVDLLKLSSKGLTTLSNNSVLQDLFFNKIITIKELEDFANKNNFLAFKALENNVIVSCISAGLIAPLSKVVDIKTENELSLLKIKAGVLSTFTLSTFPHVALEDAHAQLRKEILFPFNQINYQNIYAVQALQQDIFIRLIIQAPQECLNFINQIQHPFVATILEKAAKEYLAEIPTEFKKYNLINSLLQNRISMAELNQWASTFNLEEKDSKEQFELRVNQTVVARQVTDFERKKAAYSSGKIIDLAQDPFILGFALDNPHIKDIVDYINFANLAILKVLAAYPKVIWSKEKLALIKNANPLDAIILLHSPILFELLLNKKITLETIQKITLETTQKMGIALIEEKLIEKIKLLNEILSYPESQSFSDSEEVLLKLAGCVNENIALAFKQANVRQFFQQHANIINLISYFKDYVLLNEQQFALVALPEVQTMLQQDSAATWQKLSRLTDSGIAVLKDSLSDKDKDAFFKKFQQIGGSLALNSRKLSPEESKQLSFDAKMFLEDLEKQNTKLAEMYFDQEISIEQINQLSEFKKAANQKASLEFFSKLPAEMFSQLDHVNTLVNRIIKNDKIVQEQITNGSITCEDLNRCLAECIQLKLKYMYSVVEKYMQVQNIADSDLEKPEHANLKELRTTILKSISEINIKNFKPEQFFKETLPDLDKLIATGPTLPTPFDYLLLKLLKSKNAIFDIFANEKLTLKDLTDSQIKTQHAGIRLPFTFYKDKMKQQKLAHELKPQSEKFKALRNSGDFQGTKLLVDTFLQSKSDNKDAEDAKSFNPKFKNDFSTTPHFFKFAAKKVESTSTDNNNAISTLPGLNNNKTSEE